MRDIYGDGWIKELEGQLEAVGASGASGAKLEWYFSDPEVAQFARELFENERVAVDVFYAPKI